LDSLLKSYVSEMRRKLKNQYAYSEYMVQTEHEAALLARQITESRKLHEIPTHTWTGMGATALSQASVWPKGFQESIPATQRMPELRERLATRLKVSDTPIAK